MRNKILYSVFVLVVAALAMAPAVFGQDDRAAQVLAASRKAIGEKKLEALKALGVEASVLRNVGAMQIASDVEIALELPDKYVRSEQPNAPGMIAGGMTSGFNGDKPLQPVHGGFAGGAMVIRMGGGPPPAPGDAPRLPPEEREKIEQSVVRSQKQELSRFLLGWFAAALPSIGARYTFAGDAESPDGRAYVIDVKNDDGFAARLFIDQQTNLPLMLTYRGPQRQIVTAGGPGRTGAAPGAHGAAAAGVSPMTDEERKKARDEAEKRIEELRKQPPVMVEYTLFFEDWQPVDGVQFPRKMRRASGGETTEEWTVNSVRINPKIDARKFAVRN